MSGSGQTSGALSGAAAGAAAGAAFTPYGAIIGAVIGGIAGAFSGSANDRAQANQLAWQRYNARLQYNTSLYNVQSRGKIRQVNIETMLAGARAENAAISAITSYNSSIIGMTALYNNDLQQEQLRRIWEDEELELEQLETFRARERGGMIADQAASGTVIGEGSNEDAIIAQMTEEALDTTVIQFNANRQAADVQNQMAQSLWQGEVAIAQNEFQGAVQQYQNRTSAMLGAISEFVSGGIQDNASIFSARQGYDAAIHGVRTNQAAYNATNYQNMTSSLFNSAGRGVSQFAASGYRFSGKAGSYSSGIGGGTTSSGAGGGGAGSSLVTGG